MSADIYTESREIGYAILWGLELAFFYDGLNILRNVMRHKEIFIYIEDFIYWLSAALFVFDRLYKIGNGQIRWYMALGVGIGMFFYKLTVSKWLVKGASFILQKILWILGKILSVFVRPLRFIFGKIRKLLKIIRGRVLLSLRLLKKKLTLALKMLKIALCKR